MAEPNPKEPAVVGQETVAPVGDTPTSDPGAQAILKDMDKHKSCFPPSCCVRRSAVYKTFMPLIRKKRQEGGLTAFDKKWLKYSFVLYLQDIDYLSISYRSRFRSIRRALIFLGVLISGLILVSETAYVKDHFAAKMTLFWIAMAVSLTNNFVTAFLTDLKLAEQAVLYYKGASVLKSMGNTFLTCTQRYAPFATPHAAFRTFARDVEMCKLLITNENIGLMAAGAESKPEDPISADRQDWTHLMDPIGAEEAEKMFERV
jgi:hypothetical protein